MGVYSLTRTFGKFLRGTVSNILLLVQSLVPGYVRLNGYQVGLFSGSVS